MLFSIDREVLLENLNIIARGIPSKTPLNSLKGIKINVLDNQIIMTSSNTNISIQATINDKFNVIEEGDFLLQGNYLIEIYKLPDNYYIFVEVKDDDISKITDNSNKDFNYLHTLVNDNYNVRNYYGKTIDKIEDYHLKVEDKELEINI